MENVIPETLWIYRFEVVENQAGISKVVLGAKRKEWKAKKKKVRKTFAVGAMLKTET